MAEDAVLPADPAVVRGVGVGVEAHGDCDVIKANREVEAEKKD
jgi:hypothetical protein